LTAVAIPTHVGWAWPCGTLARLN